MPYNPMFVSGQKSSADVAVSSSLILPSSASTQSQLKLRLRLALVPPDPPTHPATRDSGFLDSTLPYFMIIQD